MGPCFLLGSLGASWGPVVGTDVSAVVGMDVSAVVGMDLGVVVGKDLGPVVGTDLGGMVGKVVGVVVGKDLGPVIGADLGVVVGKDLCDVVGTDLGAVGGRDLGVVVGRDLGLSRGIFPTIVFLSDRHQTDKASHVRHLYQFRPFPTPHLLPIKGYIPKHICVVRPASNGQSVTRPSPLSVRVTESHGSAQNLLDH